MPDEQKQEVKPAQEHSQKDRDFFQKPKVHENPEKSQSDATGSGWSGERWSGRNWGGGRER
jgi:hypothetical protein